MEHRGPTHNGWDNYPAATCTDTLLLTLLVPLLVKVFQDVRDLAHNIRAARRTARTALSLASFALEAIKLAPKYLRLRGIQRPGPRQNSVLAGRRGAAGRFTRRVRLVTALCFHNDCVAHDEEHVYEFQN